MAKSKPSRAKGGDPVTKEVYRSYFQWSIKIVLPALLSKFALPHGVLREKGCQAKDCWQDDNHQTISNHFWSNLIQTLSSSPAMLSGW